MKLRRRIGSAFLALIMVISLIPTVAVSALAAGGEIYEGNDTFYYHITDSSLANMVSEKTSGSSTSDVEQVSVTFHEDYSAGGQKTFVFRGGYTIALSNISDNVQPDDIDYLTISFVDGTSVQIPQNELSWTWVDTLPRRYDLRLATDENTCTVTFYYQYGDTVDGSSWREYKQVTVQKGQSLGDDMPALPYEQGTGHWVTWETGSNDGTGPEFFADTVVTSDLSVYARKVTNGAGTQYHIMNPDNNLYSTVLERYNNQNPENTADINDVLITDISVNGTEKSTNPNYSPIGLPYGSWQNGTSWYYIYNIDNHTLPEDGQYWNDRVDPDDIQSITIYGRVGSTIITDTILRNELDVRVLTNDIIEIYPRDATEISEPIPPDSPGKDTVIELAGDEAVQVSCIRENSGHSAAKYSLIDTSLSIGTPVSDSDGNYTCIVTVQPNDYVQKYNETIDGHSLSPDEQAGELLLTFDSSNKKWEIGGEAPYVTFNVTCTEDPNPGEANLTVEKTVALDGTPVTSASVGNMLEYTITVKNDGTADATDVKVWDSLWTDPNGSVQINGGDSYTSVAEGYCTVNVPANGTTTITYTYTVPENMAGNKLTNNVWIGNNKVPGDDDPRDTVTVTVDDLVYYNVNYHIVGDVGTSNWTNSVLAGTEYTYTVPAPLPGYIFDGWYEKESDIGNTDKKEPTTVTVNKKYEVYGKYVIDTESPPKAPDEDAVIDLLGRCVQLKCDQVTNHKCGFDLRQGSFIIGNCTADSNVWTVTVTVNADKYLEDYNTKGVGTHELAVGETGTRGIVLTWDATANNNQGAWVRPTGELLAIFDVTCKPDAPTTDDLNELFPNGVQVDCISQSGHPNKDFSPVEDDTYTTTVEQKDGKWTCKVIVTGETYVEKYEGAIGWPHTANDDTRSVTLVWENGKWAKQDNNNVMVVFDVTCQAPDAPTPDQLAGLFKVQIDCITSDKWGDQYEHKNKDYAPIEDSYTLGNATANADGTWNLVVTVKAEKYVKQYSVDRDEAHELADKSTEKTVTLVYQNGAWSKPGDTIAFAFDVKCNPKYDLVYHGCGGTTENGKETVSSTFSYFGEATIKNNPFLRDGYVFEGWALTDGGDVVYTGGEDVTFNDVNFPGLSTAKKAELYAVWALDKQGAIDPDTGEETGDGIADYRQVFVRYKSADATLGSVAPAYQVVTLDLDENGDPIVVDISLDSVATANEGAEFIYWMQGLENTVSYEASLKDAGLTLKNYTPGYTYEFTAYFMDSDIGKPEPVQTYEIDVDVTNGTGTFFGTEVTTHILARAGEVITIAFAPDAGYALDTVTVDGQPAALTADGTYTFTNVAADHSITVVYATDAWNDKDDTTTGGDGIPDKYQVVVKYVADKGGKITGKQVEVLTITVDGHYSTVGDVTATGSQAAASHNWDFSRWVTPNGGVASWHPTLGQQTIENAEGGKTYVFTAHFRYDPYIPPVVDPDPDDPTPPVDPDKPQLNTEDHYAYIVGYEDGTVRPEGDITRAEVATIFFRLLTDESRNEYWSQTNDYIDVAEGDWYNNAVSTLSNAGILNGYEDGSFQPNGNITRAEFATIAARFFEATYEGEDLFPDIEDHWARDYINQAAHAGIVNGYPNGTFQPQENITRAEAMTIVNRTLDRHPDADHFLADMITWPDNPETAWYYEQVQEATNSHEYTMNTDDEQNPYEIWTELLPVRDWAQLEKEWSDAHSGQSGGDVV